MEPVSLSQIVSLGAALQIGGPILAVLVIWWIDRRDIQKILKHSEEQNKLILQQNSDQLRVYREDSLKTLKQLEEYLKTAVQMYQSNVELVKNYEKATRDFREVVIANTTICANLNNAITHNLFCPLVRDKTGS